MIQSMAHVLDLLEEIKKYLYVRSREQEVGHIESDPEEKYLQTERSVAFQGGSEAYSPGIVFEEKVLQLHMKSEQWIVDRALRHCYTACKLKPCVRTDLKPGDIAIMSNVNPPLLDCVLYYQLILLDGTYISWCDGINIGDAIWKYHWKVLI